MSDEQFIKKVYSKYNKIIKEKSKNDFFNSEIVFEEKNTYKMLKKVALILIALSLSGGLVYAGNEIVKSYIQNNFQIEYVDNLQKEIDINMKKQNGIYYQTILEEDQMKKYYEIFPELKNEKDINFEDNFIILITTYNSALPELKIANVYLEEDILCIDLEQTEELDGTMLYAIISKDMYREEIKIKEIIESELTEYENFTNEEAIDSGFIVLESNKIISGNIDVVDKILEDIKNQIDFEIIFFERRLTNELVITKILNQNKNLTVETLVFENGEERNILYSDKKVTLSKKEFQIDEFRRGITLMMDIEGHEYEKIPLIYYE